MPIRRRMKSCFRVTVPLVVVLALVGALRSDASAGKSRWGKGYLPNVTVLTQDGVPVRFYDDVLKGRTTVVSFIYTRCRDLCPLVTARMALVYEQLGEAAGRDFQFVSVSIDPAYDTPARLKEHAEAFRSDPRWIFLTGDTDKIDQIRYKLGERSRRLPEHGAQIMLYNDVTGEWSRDSVFADLGVLVQNIRLMNPDLPVAVGADTANEPTSQRLGGSGSHGLPGQALFAKACASCHTIGGGDRVGPDLAGIVRRRERTWLSRFISAPDKMHAERDPIAVELAARYPKVRMPSLQLSDLDVTDLLGYIDARTYVSSLPKQSATSAKNRPGGQGHQGHH